MLVPLLILVPAALLAGVVAFGVHPAWAQYPHGIELILLSRRLQAPLVATVLILCLALIYLIITGKRRAWWLIGLGPILVLLAHRFALDPDQQFAVNRQPQFVHADQASDLADDDWVVGIAANAGSGPDDIAYPFAALYPAPLVAQTNQTSPMLLMWSPFANRALAVGVDRSIKPSELEVVSMPANTLLIYNSRIGQFINGLTGLTMDGRQPAGFDHVIPSLKTTWKLWRGAHPQTLVLAVPRIAGGASGGAKSAPSRPVLPFYPMPAGASAAPDFPADSQPMTVALLGQPPFAAVADIAVGFEPVNLDSPQGPVLVIRDRNSGLVHAFKRQTSGDLFPHFRAKRWPKIPAASMTDSDSASAWTADGKAIAGPLKGQKLPGIPSDDGVYWKVLRFWYPKLPMCDPDLETGK